jgi:GNAT superfamily N-acetyltransferase
VPQNNLNRGNAKEKMTFFVQADEEAKSFLQKFFQPGKPSWRDDRIQGHVLKAENGKIVSAIIYQELAHSANWVFIHALGTQVDHRKKGYARALLDNLTKKDGAPHIICLEAIDGDPGLLPMYRNFGFIPSSTHDEQIKIDIKSLGKGNNKTLVLDNKA